MSVKTVFLSSTGRDLAAYREAAYRAIEGLDGWHCVRMEDFGARDWAADDFCRARVAECDVLVGILGHLHGDCPKGSEQSFTEREYDAAVAANVPRLMFVAPPDLPLPARLIEPHEKWGRQRAFRKRVLGERVSGTFTSPEDLARQVVQAIRNWEQELARGEKAEAQTLIPSLDGLLWPEASDAAATAGFRGKSHEELLRVLQVLLDRHLGVHAQVSTFQSLADAGCDVQALFPAQGLKYGIQVKSHGDISKSDFAKDTLAQIQDSRQHGLKRLYVVLAGDLTDPSQREKVRGLHSRINRMKDEYVLVVPPERAWTLWYGSPSGGQITGPAITGRARGEYVWKRLDGSPSAAEIGGPATTESARGEHEEEDDERRHLRKLVTTKRRRLHALEIQQATRGIDTPPHVTTEIEDLRHEIAALEARMRG